MKDRSTCLETGWIWFAKQISGVFVFLLIIVHLVVNHLVAETGLMSYADVVRYLGNPWIALMESVFLILVIFHSLLGLRSIILDFNPPQKLITTLDPLFILIGAGFSVYGIWLTITIGSVVL